MEEGFVGGIGDGNESCGKGDERVSVEVEEPHP